MRRLLIVVPLFGLVGCSTLKYLAGHDGTSLGSPPVAIGVWIGERESEPLKTPETAEASDDPGATQ